MSEIKPWLEPGEVTISGQNKYRIVVDELVNIDHPGVRIDQMVKVKSKPKRLFGGKRREKGGSSE